MRVLGLGAILSLLNPSQAMIDAGNLEIISIFNTQFLKNCSGRITFFVDKMWNVKELPLRVSLCGGGAVVVLEEVTVVLEEVTVVG